MFSWQAVFPHSFTWEGGWAPGIHTKNQNLYGFVRKPPMQSPVANRHLLRIHFFLCWLLMHIFLPVSLWLRASLFSISVFFPASLSCCCQTHFKVVNTSAKWCHKYWYCKKEFTSKYYMCFSELQIALAQTYYELAFPRLSSVQTIQNIWCNF